MLFWRSPIPTVKPTRPPPTMVMGLGAGMGSLPPLRNEQMTETARRALLQRPALTSRPKLRDLLPGKAGADANRSIMLRHLVAANERKQATEEETARSEERRVGKEC